VELRPRASSVAGFLALAAFAIVALQIGHTFFPGDLAFARAGRLVCLVTGAVLLILGSRWLLKRDAIDVDALGLRFTAQRGLAFLWGAAVGFAHVLAIVGVLYLALPFELGRGALGTSAVMLASLDYLAGNFVEELLFRGYLLIALARWLGTTRAIWVLALPFGLFHFPGLEGLALVKILLTTGAMHFVYAYAFLATRSLWAAVGLHAAGNTLLHKVFGVGEPALFTTQFEQAPRSDIDVPFLVFFGVTAALAAGLSRWGRTRRGVAEYQMSE
jgi:membrane protease YdiL (CAAX protease family)